MWHARALYTCPARAGTGLHSFWLICAGMDVEAGANEAEAAPAGLAEPLHDRAADGQQPDIQIKTRRVVFSQVRNHACPHHFLTSLTGVIVQRTSKSRCWTDLRSDSG